MSSPQLAQQAAQVLAAALASLRHADMHALPSAPAAKVTRTVLVVGRGLYALQLCRLHDQSGAQVLLATTASLDYARASLAVARSFVLPKPETDLAAFSDALQRIILEHDVDLVVPAAEEALFVSYLEPGFRLAGSLNRPTLVLTSPFSVLERLHDKHEFQQLCVRAGLRSPSTTRVTSPAQALQALRTLAKAVVKPIFTRGGRAMLVVAGKSDPGSEASVASLGISPSRPHVVQEFVEGLEFSSYSVVASGVVVAHVCYSCAFPVKGFSTVRTTTRKPAILDWVSRFVASLGPHGGFSGQLGFDFIETKDGHIFPLECNPRATNGVSFFACDARLGARLAAAQCSAAAAHAGSLGLAAAVPQTEPPESPPKTPSTKPPLSPLSAKKGLASPSRVFSASPGPSSQHEPVEPAPLTSVATFLPALSLLGRTPGILSALRQAQGDIEWLRDPFPLFMALFKSLHLAATSLRPLMRGQRFADLAANATERELVKFDIKLADLEPDAEPPPPPTLQQSPDLLGAGLGVVDLTEARVLVTGATGFLGSHIVKTLLQRGCTNIVATGRSKANFLALGIDDVVDFAQCDLSDRSAVRKLVENVHLIVHCAAMCSPWGLYEDFFRDNVEVTQFLVDAARAEPSVRRFIHISSPSVAFAVDTGPRLAVKETDPCPPPGKQSNTYSLTKLMAEGVVLDASREAAPRICFVVLRPRAIYGPGDRALFPRIVTRLRQARLPQIGDGRTVVDLTHVSNVAHAVFLASQAPSGRCAGKVYNITDCAPVNLWRVVGRICQELHMAPPRFAVPRALAFHLAHAMELAYGAVLRLGINTAEPLLTRYAVNVLSTSQTLDCAAAKRDLGYRPIVSTEQGLAEFLDSIRAQELALPLKRSSRVLLLGVVPALHCALAVALFSLLAGLAARATAAASPGLAAMEGPWAWAALGCLVLGAFLRNYGRGAQTLAQERQRERARARALAKLSAPHKAASATARARPWRDAGAPEEQFALAVRAAPAVALAVATQHFAPDLYGLFKQQKDGDCDIPTPPLTRPRDLGKWRAWNSRKGLSREQARASYIEKAFDALDEACDPEADRALDSEYARKKEKNLYKVKILGVGAYRPKRVVRSEEVEALCGVESGWSGKHNVGVDTRHWADLGAGETNSFMAAAAVREACQKARVEVASLDCIINASASNERVLPDGSALVKRALGLEDCACACFSVHATCLSFVMAVDVASALIHAGRYSRVCVVSSEVASVGIDFEQPESALLLGDGAAACVLGATPRGEASAVHRAHFENHCRGLDTATLRTGTLKHPKDAWTGPKDHLFDMDGPGIVNAIREVGSAFLERVRPGLSTRLNHDLDLVVPHQASGAAMDILMAHGWPREKTVNVLASTGNCVAASTGLALYEAVESGRLKRGMKFLFCGTGGGITLGAAVLTY